MFSGRKINTFCVNNWIQHFIGGAIFLPTIVQFSVYITNESYVLLSEFHIILLKEYYLRSNSKINNEIMCSCEF